MTPPTYHHARFYVAVRHTRRHRDSAFFALAPARVYAPETDERHTDLPLFSHFIHLPDHPRFQTYCAAENV